MSNNPLIKPQEITVKDLDGEEKVFMISRVPADVGRELFTQYVPTALPKIGNYKENEKLMKKLIGYVDAKAADGSWIRLNNDPLRNAHITDWEMMVTIEKEMVNHNTNFFNPAKLSSVLERFNQTLPDKVMSMLTRLSDRLSVKGKQR